MRRLGLAARIAVIASFSLVSALVLATVVAFGYAALEPTTFPNAGVEYTQPLRIPALLQPRLVDGVKVFDLKVMNGSREFTPGVATATLGFNGDYLGPTLAAKEGDQVRIGIDNQLGEPVTVHWHGMEVPPAMDGGPHQEIAAGGRWEPNWPVLNEAATLWYHSHMAGKTGEQVYRGLAGLFLIDDPRAAALGLPHDYGVDDIPLIVQDRRFDAAGQFIYSAAHTAFLSPGMLGDTILVSGTVAPYLELPATLVRLRLLNGSNARRYNFAFADGRAFQQIASDGGLLAAPVERTSLLVAPAERAEIVVDLTGVTEPLTLISLAIEDQVDIFSNLSQAILVPGNDENQQFGILELRPMPTSVAPRTVPAQLNTIKRLSPEGAQPEREFVLDQDGRTISGKGMDHARVDHVVVKGETEIWLVRNFSSSYHPFHIHGVQFQVLDRDGAAPAPFEAGWKDTVTVPPAANVRLIMRFTAYADPHLPYMFHCHILEHEDMGMMGQFVVVDSRDDKVELTGPVATRATVHAH